MKQFIPASDFYEVIIKSKGRTISGRSEDDARNTPPQAPETDEEERTAAESARSVRVDGHEQLGEPMELLSKDYLLRQFRRRIIELTKAQSATELADDLKSALNLIQRNVEKRERKKRFREISREHEKELDRKLDAIIKRGKSNGVGVAKPLS